MAMTLSAVMNLTGNFQAQLQQNVAAMRGAAQQAQTTGQSIRQAFNDSTIGQGLANGMSRAKDAMGAAGIASLGFLKTSVDAAAKAQKTNADLAQTIKSTGGAAGLTADEVSSMADQLSKTNLASTGMIKQGQNMLLTFTNIGKDVFPEATQAMLDMAQKMKTDPVNSSIQLGKALNDPANGLTALTRVGVTFTDQQKQQVQAMQAAGDMAGAQRVILGELNKEFGGQGAAALNTYDGQMQKFGQTLTGIKSSIGSALLPYLQQVATALNNGAQAVKGFANEHKTLFAVILSITGVLGTFLGGLGLITKIASFLGPAIEGIGALIAALSGPILAVIAAIAALVYAYINDFGGIRTFVEGVINEIVSAFQLAIDVFHNTGSAIAAVSAFIGNLLGDDAADIVADRLDSIKNIIIDLVNTVKGHLPQLESTISNVFNNIKNIVVDILGPISSFIISTIGQIIDWIINNWPLIFQTISTVMNAISSIISSVLDAISSFWSAHGTTILAVASNIWDAIKTVISTAITVIEDIITAVMDIITGNWSGAWNEVSNAVSTIFGGVITIIQDIIDSIGNIFADIAKTAYNWGADMINGIVDGIKSGIGAIGDAAKSVAGEAAAFLHFSTPDRGPLASYGQWMPDFMQGLSNGIKVNAHLVTDQVSSLSFGIKNNTLNGLSGGVAQMSNKTVNNNGGSKSITIAKLADSIVVRQDSDIDAIATALANKLVQTDFAM